LDSDPAFFAPRRIDWVEKIIAADLILCDTVIRIEWALLPASETRGGI
jgi:hypothetical protein